MNSLVRLAALSARLTEFTANGRAKYNRETGSNLKAPAPNPKSDADAGRKKSFCARSQGWDGKRGLAARRRWAC